MSTTTPLLDALETQTGKVEAIAARLQKWLEASDQLKQIEAERLRLWRQCQDLEGRLQILTAREQELLALLPGDDPGVAVAEALAQLQQASAGLEGAPVASLAGHFELHNLRGSDDPGAAMAEPPVVEIQVESPRAEQPAGGLFSDLFSEAEELGDTSGDGWQDSWGFKAEEGQPFAEETSPPDALLLLDAEEVSDQAPVFSDEWDTVPVEAEETAPARTQETKGLLVH